MTASVGFRVGLLLEDFFSDLRRRCYFFVDTSKIQLILDLKESLIKKFELPSNIQLLHNRFLLLEEDPVQLLQQDDLIQVVEPDAEAQSKKEKKKKRKYETMQGAELSYSSLLACDAAETTSSPVKKKKKHKHKDKHHDLGASPKAQHSKSHDKSIINTEPLVSCDTSFERIATKPFDYSMHDINQISDHHRKKKKSLESILNNSQYMDFTVNNPGGTAAFSSPYNYDLSLQRQSTGGELDITASTSAYLVRKSLPNETLEGVPDNITNSLKRKIKNEQTRLKHSGIAEVLKTIQNVSKTSVLDESTVNFDAQTDDSSLVPKPKRKRVRPRRKKSKVDESSSVSCSSQQSAIRESFKHVPVVKSNVRLHKRFNSDENINAASQDIDNQDELNANLRLCNQISPLTPPSEHNSEDDVYKKLLDLRKMNKPVVFERKRSVDTNMIDDSGSSRLSTNQVAEVPVPITFVGADPHFVPIAYDQFDAAASEEILMSQAASSVHSNSDDVDKDNSSSGAESKSNDRDCSKKDTCPVHIKKNICDINLDKIDVNNYPVIESTRKNDILVFKTLKLSASLCPTVSSLILARVLDVTGDNVILFEILSGKGEFDHLKDEESDTSDPLISLKWGDLFEPRLVYP